MGRDFKTERSQVEYACLKFSKACKRVHYLRVCRTAHLPWDIGLTTYITKIRPVLEYASPVGGGLPIYLEEDLQRVQNRCLNVIGLPRDTIESLVTPGGRALGYFLGGYVPPGTPNWHPVVTFSLKLIPRSRNGPIFYTPF